MKDFFENLLSNGELQEKVAELQGKIDAYQMSENEANEIIAELKAYKDVNEDFKTAWEELKAENDSLKEENYQLQKDCQICENFIDFIPCKPIRDMDYDLQNVINQRDKYIQTLQEIKKICKNSHTSASEDYYRTADKILQEINEVIGAEE